MSNPEEPRPAAVRRRLRRAAGRLLEDSSLRSHLTDQQAQQLLDWGLAHLEETTTATFVLSKEEADSVLEEKVTAVRDIMQDVNRVVGSVGETAETESTETAAFIDERLMRLLKNLSHLSGEPTALSHVVRVDQFKGKQLQLDKESAFQELMALVQAKAPASNKEEEE